MARSTSRERDEWQLQEAKAQFSEVVRRASADGPQWVTKQGRPAAVILSVEDYERLRAPKRQQRLSEFLRTSPLADEEIMFERSSDPIRDVSL